MTLRRAVTWIVIAALAVFLVYKLRTSHFDWHTFAQSLRAANPWILLLAVLSIYGNNLFRAVRWAIFLRPAQRAAGVARTPWTALVGSQFIGFAGLAIFGRVGELIRPILIARRTSIGLPTQIAILAVERVFDLAAFALIFAANLMLSPGLQGLPHIHEAAGFIVALTAALCGFIALTRFAGAFVARTAGKIAGLVSKPAGVAVAEKVLLFRDGLGVIPGPLAFAQISLLSLGLWATVAAAYSLVILSFAEPVHSLGVVRAIVMMGFSVAGSAIPVPGGSGAWGGNVVALQGVFNMPKELATSAGLLVWIVTTWAVVPAGLLYARLEGVSLRQTTHRSESEENKLY